MTCNNNHPTQFLCLPVPVVFVCPQTLINNEILNGKVVSNEIELNEELLNCKKHNNRIFKMRTLVIIEED